MKASNPDAAKTRRRLTLPILAVALTGLCVMTWNRSSQGQPAAKPRAVWVWQPQDIAAAVKNDTARDEFFNFAKQQGMGTLFLNPNDLLDPEPLPGTDARHLEKAEIGGFIRYAHANGFKVEALQGDPEFASPANHQSALDRLNRALAYNKSVPAEERWDGMQWDIEPYTLPAFRTDEGRQKLMSGFLTLAAKMKIRVDKEQKDFTIGFAMPFWMDTTEQNVTWNGVTKPATFHLYDLLKPMPNSYIALMSYRDNAEGTKDVCAQEIAYAQKNAPNVKLWVGQELNELPGEPRVVTYFDNGFDTFRMAAVELDKTYAEEPAVSGIAIHDWKGYKVLMEKG